MFVLFSLILSDNAFGPNLIPDTGILPQQGYANQWVSNVEECSYYLPRLSPSSNELLP